MNDLYPYNPSCHVPTLKSSSRKCKLTLRVCSLIPTLTSSQAASLKLCWEIGQIACFLKHSGGHRVNHIEMNLRLLLQSEPKHFTAGRISHSAWGKHCHTSMYFKEFSVKGFDRINKHKLFRMADLKVNSKGEETCGESKLCSMFISSVRRYLNRWWKQIQYRSGENGRNTCW